MWLPYRRGGFQIFPMHTWHAEDSRMSSGGCSKHARDPGPWDPLWPSCGWKGRSWLTLSGPCGPRAGDPRAAARRNWGPEASWMLQDRTSLCVPEDCRQCGQFKKKKWPACLSGHRWWWMLSQPEFYKGTWEMGFVSPLVLRALVVLICASTDVQEWE